MNSAASDTVSVTSRTASHRLFQGGIVALVLTALYFLWTNDADITLPTLLGLLIMAGASLPALLWAKNQRTWFPAFEISMLACIAFYAIPLLNRQDDLSGYRPEIVVQGALLALVYVVSANFGFSIVRRAGRASPWASTSLLPESTFRYLHVGVMLNTVYIYLSAFTTIIPYNIDGTLRALLFGAGTISIFILARLWGLGQLKRQFVALLIVNLAIQLILLFSTLYLIGGISLISLTLIAYSSARRKIPWLVLLVCLPVLALLHLGKARMREIYWKPDAAPISLSDLPAYYSEWFDYSLRAREEHAKDPSSASSIFQRASLIQMLCLSANEVPDRRPFLYGQSYIDIPAQIIPRFLWPEKPSSLLSNIRLALYFNLVSEDSAFKVSIAFGMIAEAYINFGFVGVALLGLLFGMGFKRIALLSGQAVQFSALGIFMILLTAWSFQAEQVLATWTSSLFQACAISIGVPVLWKKFFGAN